MSRGVFALCVLSMTYVFASARFPSDFGFVYKKARCKVGSVDKISAQSAMWGEVVVVTLFREIRIPTAFEQQIGKEKDPWRGGRAACV